MYYVAKFCSLKNCVFCKVNELCKPRFAETAVAIVMKAMNNELTIAPYWRFAFFVIHNSNSKYLNTHITTLFTACWFISEISEFSMSAPSHVLVHTHIIVYGTICFTYITLHVKCNKYRWRDIITHEFYLLLFSSSFSSS